MFFFFYIVQNFRVELIKQTALNIPKEKFPLCNHPLQIIQLEISGITNPRLGHARFNPHIRNTDTINMDKKKTDVILQSNAALAAHNSK